MSHVAFLGLGRMGTPMARRLVAAGYQVTGWNRTRRRVDALVPDGVEPAFGPAEAVAGADVVVTMLADPDAIHAVVGTAAGAMRDGSCLVETSTIGPDAVRRVRELLPAGVGLVDAPVMGSVDAAAAGQLTTLAGGAAEDLDRDDVTGVLASLGRVVRCGGPGQGAATKLVLATAVFGAVPLVGEALRVAQALGVDDGLARDLLAASPVGGVVERVRSATADFGIDLAAKDLDLATAAAPDLTVTAAAAGRLHAASGRGHGAGDLAGVVTDICRVGERA